MLAVLLIATVLWGGAGGYRVRTDLPVVALSFDDGPYPRFTLQVLKILRQHDATATFFLIGERAIRYPDMVSQIKTDTRWATCFKNGPALTHSDADFAAYLEQTEKTIGISAVSVQMRSGLCLSS